MLRPNVLATQFFLATGQELNITNTGRIDFTIAVDLPYGMGVQTWQSRMNPDGSLTFLGQSVR